MITKDLHTHTVYCDGRDTPESMILSAIEKGLDTIGISGHSYTFFDTSYCMKKEDIPRYVAELRYLRAKYYDKIHVLCGVEQDYYSDFPTDMFDYSIGSVHYLKLKDEYVPVDESPEILRNAAEKYFCGDVCALCEEYYKTVADVVRKTACDIIGHFDLVSKFNDDGTLFDPGHPKYVEAWTNALNKIFSSAAVGSLFTSAQRNGASITGAPLFEINTGAMSRGYRTAPYPAADILRAICMRGGRIIITSDSHDASTQDACFEEAADLARETGFTEQTVLTDEGFISIPL